MHDPWSAGVSGLFRGHRSHLVTPLFQLVILLCLVSSLYIPLHSPSWSPPHATPSPSHSPSPSPTYPLPMHHFISYAGLGRKSKGQQKSTLRLATSPSLPKGEWEKEKDVEASDSLPHCHFDLGSRDVSRLDSTSQSNIEDTSACKGDAITGRYIPRFAPPYNRDRSDDLSLFRPASIHSEGPGRDSAPP
jgi:hypothetical protein